MLKKPSRLTLAVRIVAKINKKKELTIQDLKTFSIADRAISKELKTIKKSNT